MFSQSYFSNIMRSKSEIISFNALSFVIYIYQLPLNFSVKNIKVLTLGKTLLLCLISNLRFTALHWILAHSLTSYIKSRLARTSSENFGQKLATQRVGSAVSTGIKTSVKYTRLKFKIELPSFVMNPRIYNLTFPKK